MHQQGLPKNCNDIGELREVDADEVFEKALPLLINELYADDQKPNCKRSHEVFCTTLYNQVSKVKKKAREEEQRLGAEAINAAEVGSSEAFFLPNSFVWPVGESYAAFRRS